MYSKRFQRFLIWLSPLASKTPELIDSVNDAKRAWKQALAQYNHVTDRDLVDFSIHNIKAAERRYMALIKQAKEEGISAWPSEICSQKTITFPEENSKAIAG